ncbi:MAG TPA: T9SS type A sorting domain-containing protein [Caldithrix abyssi]|uniref:T9SS type A sorting domain-containing protein n=1 Tax=Caldithrix abyssi TaxID=187145 RepID=A0A7V4TZ00_CALAY|nr:T9SS type A sorting domain-containing protein [Caldithrix abyssi]
MRFLIYFLVILKMCRRECMKAFTLLVGLFAVFFPLFAQIQTSEILYEIRTDKPVYVTTERVQWYARMINVSADTLVFDIPTGWSFFEWSLIDSSGKNWDGSVVSDSFETIILSPGDSLTHTWYTQIDRSFYPLPPNLYYGLMTPYYKYDSLQADTVSFSIITATILRQPAAPEITEFRIIRLYPNPFNGSMQIDFEILKDGQYDLSIYDLSGRKISTLVTARLNTGNYSFTWNAYDVSSGVYLVQLSDGRLSVTQKALYIK